LNVERGDPFTTKAIRCSERVAELEKSIASFEKSREEIVRRRRPCDDRVGRTARGE
jgi:hypothetical protein